MTGNDKVDDKVVDKVEAKRLLRGDRAAANSPIHDADFSAKVPRAPVWLRYPLADRRLRVVGPGFGRPKKAILVIRMKKC